MTTITEATETAYEMFLTHQLSEAEIMSLVEQGLISGLYLKKLEESYLSEGVVKKIATHPLTTMAAGATLGAGGVYLGTHPELIHQMKSKLGLHQSLNDKAKEVAQEAAEKSKEIANNASEHINNLSLEAAEKAKAAGGFVKSLIGL